MTCPCVTGARCTYCGARISVEDGGAPPPTVTLAGTFPRVTLVFCHELCAGRWALAELGRLRGWLARIAARTRGMASGLASQALHSQTVAGAPRGEKDRP